MDAQELEQGLSRCRMEIANERRIHIAEYLKVARRLLISHDVEPTRIIPISASRPLQREQPSNVIRMEPDPGLIKMDTLLGRNSLSGGDAESSQRFASEVTYVTFFAQKLADTLGMHQLQLGIVEDREGQTAFHASSSGWHGVVSGSRRAFKQVRESLARN